MKPGGVVAHRRDREHQREQRPRRDLDVRAQLVELGVGGTGRCRPAWPAATSTVRCVTFASIPKNVLKKNSKTLPIRSAGLGQPEVKRVRDARRARRDAGSPPAPPAPASDDHGDDTATTSAATAARARAARSHHAAIGLDSSTMPTPERDEPEHAPRALVARLKQHPAPDQPQHRERGADRDRVVRQAVDELHEPREPAATARPAAGRRSAAPPRRHPAPPAPR